MTRRQRRQRRRAIRDLIFIATVLAGAALLALTVREAVGSRAVLSAFADAQFYEERTCP
jgi:hypothetical protein